jgi:hypothetical protein
MAYTPFTAINNSRDFRNQYLRKSLSVWVKKFKARYQKRHELGQPIALRVAKLAPPVNRTGSYAA